MKKIFFSSTTPFAVNSFLKPHLIRLSKTHDVNLCVNLELYTIDPQIEEKVKLIHIDFERKMSPLKDLKTLYKIYKLLKQERPHSIHSIMPKSGLITMIAAWLARTPNRFHTFTGQIWANKTGASRLILKILDKLIVFTSTKAFTDSTSQSLFLEKEKIAPKGYLSTLGIGSIAGVNTQRFKQAPLEREKTRKELNANHNHCIFLYVGRLAKDKGIYGLIQAFSIVQKGNKNAKLWVVGPDEEEIRSSLQLKYQHLKEDISWLGPTTKPEKYMAAADIFVLASMREGFGSVLIEAAACSVPSVAYRIDGVIDSVKENETGLLAKKGDVSELSSKMNLLLNDKELRKKLGSQALKRAQLNFTEEKITNEWIKLYNKI